MTTIALEQFDGSKGGGSFRCIKAKHTWSRSRRLLNVEKKVFIMTFKITTTKLFT